MPDIQALYEEYGGNQGDLVVLGVAAPGLGQEGTQEEIAIFLEENGYTFPTVMDTEYQLTYQYGIRAYPHHLDDRRGGQSLRLCGERHDRGDHEGYRGTDHGGPAIKKKHAPPAPIGAGGACLTVWVHQGEVV